MEFGVLGTVEAWRAGERVGLGSFRQRSLLALLLIHANTVVSTDRILDELWGDEIGADRQNALWVHVSNLRSALEPDRPARTEGSVVLTRPPGYVAQVDPAALDAWRFEELLREGRLLLDTDAAAASVVIGEALALWRGHAYEDFAYESFAQAEIARLEELRLEAVELRLDADLRRGLAAELVGELEGLVRVHPLRERMTAKLMLALYRSGRTSEALRAYQRLRAGLTDELGVDPSAELQQLEGRIVAGDRSLLSDATGGPARLGPVVRGYELREKVDDGHLGPAYRAYQPLVGREVTIRVVRPDLADDADFIRRFEADAEAVAHLEHPHIAPLFDYWREPGAAYLVTPHFPAGSLGDALRAGPLAPERAATLVRDVSAALSFAHSRGVVHGAVRPATVMLDDDGAAHLGEFALLGDRAGDPAYASPEQLAGASATARSDVYGLGRVLAAAVGTQPPPSFTDVIDRATAEDPGDRFATASEFAAAVDAVVGAGGDGPSIPSDNPYKGLRAFGEADAAEFFGRERVVERLLNRIGEGGSRGRLVALVGPSGSGKSSVVRAGLIPALRAGAVPGSADWFVTDMTPGAQPFESLAVALGRVAVDGRLDLVGELSAGDAGIRHTIDRVLPDRRAQLVLVIDQFEELFTLAPEATCRAFLDALVGAVTQGPTRLRVVVTLRADYYDRPLSHRAFGELVRRGTEVLTPLTPDELERAVSGPAERAGVRFDRGLIAAIVADVADRPGALPLLQFALTELFERRRGGVIDVAAYAETGGVGGALVHRAEAVHDELDDSGRTTARQVLLRLVAIGDDASATVARKRVLREELSALGPSVDEVLDRLAHSRLLTFDSDVASRGPTVEVAHEALLTEWTRLRSWIDDARNDLHQHRRLVQRVDEWLAGGRDDADLLHGPQLERVAAWASTTDLFLTAGEREFLEAGLERDAAERRVRVEREQKEVRLQRTARRRARLLVGAAAALAVVVGLASFAIVQRGEATRLADDLEAVADARRLATTSSAIAGDDAQLALLLALQSLETSAHAGIPALVESEEALHWALQAASVAYPVVDGPVDVRIGPRGLTGIYHLPFDDLVALARESVTRTLTSDECDSYGVAPCPAEGQGLASPAANGPRPLPSTDSLASDTAAGGASLAGTSISIGYFNGPNATTEAVHERFEEATGIRVEHRIMSGDLDSLPDIVTIPAAQPQDFARDLPLIDLWTYIDEGDARRIWGDFFVERATVDDRLVGLPYGLGTKGLVWYQPAAFESAGYDVPATWDELLALSERMVADGRVPWCMGLETEEQFGAWPATDWIEALVLRIGGVELYDRWVSHEIEFDDPAIRQAVSMYGEVVFGEGFLRGTPEAIARANIFEAHDPMLDDPPGCWLSHMPSFFPELAREGAVAGVDYDFFVLPPIEQGGPAPIFGEASLFGAVSDRPEVREFLRMTMDPGAIPAWAASADELFVPANAGFDSDDCASEFATPEETNDLRSRLCEVTLSTFAAGDFRIDASDAMPPGVGFPGELDERGAFLVGMTEYVTRGPGNLDDVLEEIEAAWPD
jgi:DNA-binding SARP family transcriptional activator/ABC-type glycerol-3-phosphate transport system substrate-binding protein